MRLAGQRKMGYYPTPSLVVERLKAFLQFPQERVSFFDPCCGTGEALRALVEAKNALTYGIELDADRAAEARRILSHVVHCSYDEARITNGCFSCLFLNPPYDWEQGEESLPSERKELSFLKNTLKYLQPGGLLIYIIPGARVDKKIAGILEYRFEGLRLYRFPEEVYEPFKQVCILALKRAKPSPDEGLASRLVAQAQENLKELPEQGAPFYQLPSGKPVALFRSTSLDLEQLQKELAQSPLWSGLRTQFTPRDSRLGNPPLPLHTGHLGLLMAAGCFDGLVGEGEERHVVAGRVEKVVLRTEECREDGVTEERELERYRVTIRLLLRSGDVRTLT